MYRVKLQKTVRSDGYIQYFISLSKQVVEKLGWEKGDELIIDTIVIDVNTRTKEEWKGVLIMNPRDCYRALPEDYCRDRLGASC